MLKIKLSESDWKKLPEVIQKEYKKTKDDDGESYVLDHDGPYQEDLDKVLGAKENEVTEHKKTKGELKKIKGDYELLESEKTKSSDDVKAAETKLTEKHSREVAKLSTRMKSLRDATERSMREAAESQLSSELFKEDSVKLGRPHVRERIRVDWSEDDEKGDVATLVYLDDKGNPTTKERLAKYFSTQDDYKSIIKGTQASGAGGAPGSGPVGSDGLPPVPQNGQSGPQRQAWQQPTDAQLLAGVDAMSKQ